MNWFSDMCMKWLIVYDLQLMLHSLLSLYFKLKSWSVLLVEFGHISLKYNYTYIHWERVVLGISSLSVFSPDLWWLQFGIKHTTWDVEEEWFGSTFVLTEDLHQGLNLAAMLWSIDLWTWYFPLTIWLLVMALATWLQACNLSKNSSAHSSLFHSILFDWMLSVDKAF
jgi:hypothetical protein